MTLIPSKLQRHAPRQLSRLSRTFTTTPRQRAEHVRIVEVGPRDGLQNEKTSIPLATKIELVRRLAQTGLQTIEAGSFVSPKWVPQMANSSEILEHILQTPPPSQHPITYQWLLPNIKGLETFLSTLEKNKPSASPNSTSSYPTPPSTPPSSPLHSSNPSSSPTTTPHPPTHEISIFTAATDTFSLRNTNCTTAESLKRFEPLITTAKSHSLAIRAYISVALGCPYEGPNTSLHAVASLALKLLDLDATEISIADTTGQGTPPKTSLLLRTLLHDFKIPVHKLAFHFHDTYGLALPNIMTALEHGIRVFDGAVAGLGGCPYSPGATGNVATEDLVYLMGSLGMGTGVSLEDLSDVGGWVSERVGRGNESRAGKAVLARLKKGKVAEGGGCV